MKMSKTRSAQQGFTLIELMIVVAIIGILAAIAIPKFADLVKKSQEGKTRGNLTSVRSALSIYYGDNEGIYPYDNMVSMVPKYLKEIPEAHVPGFSSEGHNGHVKGSGVTTRFEFVTDTNTHTGQWAYLNNNASTNWGTFWVYCSHNDSKTIDWHTR